MTRTINHRKGDTSAIKKNKAGSKRIPRKEWCDGKLRNKYARKEFGFEQIKSQ